MCQWKQEVGVMQERGPKPKNASGLQKLEKAKNRFFPRDFRKGKSCQPLDFSPVKLISDFLPRELSQNNLVLF